MTEQPPSKDRKFFAAILIIASALAIGPYLVGVALTPANHQFQGNTVLSPGDPNVYYSYIEQARQGAFLMRDVFTSERHQATLWQPVWLVLGWLGNFFHLSTPAVYALGRVLSLILFLFTVRWAAQHLWADRLTRRAALLTVLAASGFGWIDVLLSHQNLGDLLSLPPDLWVSEMIPMVSSWTTPHFLLVTSGYLFVLTSVEMFMAHGSWRRWWLVGLVSLVTLSIHPYHLLTWLVFWVVRTVWQWIQTKKFPVKYVCSWGSLTVLSLPAIIYYLLGIVADPIVIERARQNINLTPDWWMVGVGLGALPVLAILGWRSLRHQKNQGRIWLATWAIIHVAVIFFPLSGQRRLMQALVVPFALLTAPLIAEVWKQWSKTWSQKIAFISVSLVLLSGSLFFTGHWIIHDYQLERQGRDNWEYFLSPEYQALFSYLKSHTRPNEPILASLWDSNLLAGFTARTVIVGHPVETIHYEGKLMSVKGFFQSATPLEQQKILHDMGACYVLDGPRERAYGYVFQPAQLPILRRVWVGQTMALYKTTECE